MILEDQLLLDDTEQQDSSHAIYNSARTPRIVSYALPATIVATIVLLVTSNLSSGATIDLSVRIGDRFVSVPSVFQFSLGKTASELYQAGIYPLLLLVVGFSGVWPYVKVRWLLCSVSTRLRGLLTFSFFPQAAFHALCMHHSL